MYFTEKCLQLSAMTDVKVSRKNMKTGVINVELLQFHGVDVIAIHINIVTHFAKIKNILHGRFFVIITIR